MFKTKLYPTLLGLLVMVLALWFETAPPQAIGEVINRLNAMVYDTRLKSFLGEGLLDERIVIVDIDEASLRSEGQWPWPRDRIGQLIENLFEYGVAVVSFDFVFAEEERNSLAQVLNRLHETPIATPLIGSLESMLSRFDNNLYMAEKMAQNPVVLGYIFDNQDAPPVGQLPPPLTTSWDDTLHELTLNRASSYTAPLPILSRSAAAAGFFSLIPDSDGTIRRAPLLTYYGDRLYPSLALATIQAYLGDPVDLRVAQEDKLKVIDAITLGNLVIPTDRRGNVLIPYIGAAGSFHYVSAADVLHRRADPSLLDGTIVLIGTTAGGLFDLRSTPVQSVYPGVEVHANLIAGIIDGTFPAEPSWATGANFIAMLILGLVLSIVMPRLSPIALATTLVLLLALLVAGNFYLWYLGLSLPLAVLFIMIALIGIFSMGWGYFVESSGKRFLKEMFGQYIPPQLVEQMSKNPDLYNFDGESRELSVLFCDIRSFTTISESLSAQELKRMLNRYFTPMTEIIFHHHGTIDKYVGDMIMAFWGAPVNDPHHARHAIQAAMAMLAKTVEMQAELKANGYPTIRIGAGINTGVMNVGDMGSSFRRAYTVIGDAVNLASRLEGSSKFYGVDLVVGEQTYAQTKDDFLFRELDLVKVKGKNEAIRIYEPVVAIADASDALRHEMALLDRALAAFRQRQWREGRELFQQLLTQRPGHSLYRLYLDRIDTMEQNDPGPEWDGVYTHTSK
jgi:adenylate cyclase